MRDHGLVSTLDFNRCIAQFSDGWQPSFNLPQPERIDFAASAPDLTNPAFRAWFWNVMYRKALDPALAYPGEALWIDEFDEMGAAPAKMKLAGGGTFGDQELLVLLDRQGPGQGWLAMAMGSFAPVWKPHGVGESRWPLDRDPGQQEVARRFSTLRYELMPYLYSMAHEASVTGMPMAGAMLLGWPSSEEAWRFDLQYMWGPDLLIAPYTSPDKPQQVWLVRAMA